MTVHFPVAVRGSGRCHDEVTIGTAPKRSSSQGPERRRAGGRGAQRLDRVLRVVVGVEPVALLPQPADDELDVVPGPAGHLVADRLRVRGDARPPDPVAQLAELVPDLLPLPAPAPRKPPLRAHPPILPDAGPRIDRMVRLHVVRHGEATGEGADPGLSPAGTEQSRLLAERLRGEAAVEIRHSPRRRAVETAAVLGDLLGLPVVADGLLDDRTPVPAPGSESDYPLWMREWFSAVPADERDVDGAHLSAVADAYLAGDRPVVLVTHAFVVAWFVREVLGAPRTAWTAVAVANAGLTTIDRRPGRPPQLAGVNDVGHLHRPHR